MQVWDMNRRRGTVSLAVSWTLLYSLGLDLAFAAFLPSTCPKHQNHFRYRNMRSTKLLSKKDEINDRPSEPISSFEDAESKSSQGIVSTLTNVVNFAMDSIGAAKTEDKTGSSGSITSTFTEAPPSSPEELLCKIRDDYVINNYLWTGDIYTPAFEKDCRFTDPTLSFVGTDTFVSNVQNLKPIVDTLATECKSELLNIDINGKEGYIESRWNMIGDLSGLPWKPRIDVIGKTKFWYRQVKGEEGVADGYLVFFYDEKWEMPAAKALLQLVTPTW